MIFNVQNFGAKGDGITDDTAAIQSAIDAAAAAGGGQVYMPTGTYIVSGGVEPSDGCLMLKSNVYLYGDGMGATTVKVADGSDTKITGVIRSAYGEETHDFGVSNLTIDGNRDHTTGKIDDYAQTKTPLKERRFCVGSGKRGSPVGCEPQAFQLQGRSPFSSLMRVGRPITSSALRNGSAGSSSTLAMRCTSHSPRATSRAAATGGTPAV
jgi:hypothetical protein